MPRNDSGCVNLFYANKLFLTESLKPGNIVWKQKKCIKNSVIVLFSLISLKNCSDGRRKKKKKQLVQWLCNCHVETQQCLRLCVFYRVTHAGDRQANRYFDFGHWFFSCRRSTANGRGQ